MLKMRFFDFEVTPNWWLCVFGDMPESHDDVKENIKDSFTVINSDMPNCRDLLINKIREVGYVQCGYNIKGYDLIIANAIYQGFTPKQVKLISDMIVNPGLMYSTKEAMMLSSFVKKKLKVPCYQDLMDDGDLSSLKEKEAILGLNILESSVDFSTENMTDEEKVDMTYYCKQDVYASMIYYIKVVDAYTKVKMALGKQFNIAEETCHMSTNARLVSIVLGGVRRTFDDADTIKISLPAKIREYCYDNLDHKVLERLLNENTAFTVRLFDNDVSFGNGGIHSIYKNNLYLESNDEWILMNVDATSYYPSMLIQFDCLSRAVKNPAVFKDIFDERVRIKHKKNKTAEDQAAQLAYKLVLNTTFGASGNKWLDIFDPYMCTRCCRLGQIFLASLASKLYKTVPQIKIIQTNTDGILCYFRKKDIDKVRACEQEWTRVSGINMEEDDVEKIWQRDVNNYLMIKDGGKVKRKGLWLVDTWEKPGYVMVSPLSAYACQKAIIEYLAHGKDIMKSLIANTNVTDFVMTCKKGPSYRGVVQRLEDGTEVDLYRCNRVYASKDKSLGMIYKYKMYKGNVSYAKIANIPEHCRLINEDLQTYTFDDIKKDLDYMFYVNRCAELLDIPWLQIDGDKEYYTNKFDYFNNL